MVFTATGTVTEGRNVPCTGRIVDDNGIPYQRSSMTSWSLKVLDPTSSTPQSAVYTLNGQDPTLVIYDTPQSAASWNHSQGFNFHHVANAATMAAAGFTPKGGKTYTFQYTFTLTDGTVDHAIFRVTYKAVA